MRLARFTSLSDGFSTAFRHSVTQDKSLSDGKQARKSRVSGESSALSLESSQWQKGKEEDLPLSNGEGNT
jgi:hypothetical protein